MGTLTLMAAIRFKWSHIFQKKNPHKVRMQLSLNFTQYIKGQHKKIYFKYLIPGIIFHRRLRRSGMLYNLSHSQLVLDLGLTIQQVPMWEILIPFDISTHFHHTRKKNLKDRVV